MTKSWVAETMRDFCELHLNQGVVYDKRTFRDRIDKQDFLKNETARNDRKWTDEQKSKKKQD